MRIKGFGCKEPVSWKPVFLISKYVGVSGLSFATKTNSGKAGIFLIHGRIGRKILHLGQLEPLLPCIFGFPLKQLSEQGKVGSGSSPKQPWHRRGFRSSNIVLLGDSSMDRSTIQTSLLGSASICHLGNSWWISLRIGAENWRDTENALKTGEIFWVHICWANQQGNVP